jgi:hypothetical protein
MVTIQVAAIAINGRTVGDDLAARLASNRFGHSVPLRFGHFDNIGVRCPDRFIALWSAVD